MNCNLTDVPERQEGKEKITTYCIFGGTSKDRNTVCHQLIKSFCLDSDEYKFEIINNYKNEEDKRLLFYNNIILFKEMNFEKFQDCIGTRSFFYRIFNPHSINVFPQKHKINIITIEEDVYNFMNKVINFVGYQEDIQRRFQVFINCDDITHLKIYLSENYIKNNGKYNYIKKAS